MLMPHGNEINKNDDDASATAEDVVLLIFHVFIVANLM